MAKLWNVNPNGESAGAAADADPAARRSDPTQGFGSAGHSRPAGAPHPAETPQPVSAAQSVSTAQAGDPRTGPVKNPATGPATGPSAILFGSMQDGIMVPRGMVIGGLVTIAALVIVVLGLLIALLFASFDGGTDDAAKTKQQSSEKQVESTPEPEKKTGIDDGSDQDPGTAELRERFTIGNVTLSVSSIEPVSLISTNDGGTLAPDAGKKLYLLKTAYVNSTNQVDLSCGDPEVELKMLDADGREIEQVPGLELVPGNLGCGQSVFPANPSEWNIVFEGDADAKPAELVVSASAEALAAQNAAGAGAEAGADPAAAADPEAEVSTDPVTVKLG